MPVYDYRCTKCENTYDIFHKGSEILDNVVCPKCESTEFKKLFSAPIVKMGSSDSSCDTCTTDSTPSYGGCSGGMCGL